MKKLISIILVLISLSSYGQTPPRTGYLVQPAKWKFVNPIWLDSGAYITKIPKYGGQNRYLVYDSITGKVGYRYVSSATTIDTTSLSNRINAKVPYTGATTNVNIGANTYIGHSLKSDASDGVLIEAANGTDVGIFGAGNTANSSLYGGLTIGSLTSGNGTDSVVVANSTGLLKKRPSSAFGSSYTGGNGILVSGSTIYGDTTKLASRYSPSFVTKITTPLVVGGTTTTSPLTFKTTTGVGTTGADMHFLVGNNGGTEAMTILNSGTIGINTNAPTAGCGLEIKDKADALYLNNTLGSRTTLALHSGNYTQIVGDGSELNISTLGGTSITFGTNSIQRGFWSTSGDFNIGNSSNFTTYGKLGIQVAPTATANYGLVSLGSGAFNGATSGFFTGAAAGTLIAGNLASGSTADHFNFQTGGVSYAKLNSTGLFTPTIIGGTSTTSPLTFKTTTGIGASGADHIFQVGNNGATEAMRILNNGNVVIGSSSSSYKFNIGAGTIKAYYNPNTSQGVLYMGTESNHPVAFAVYDAEVLRFASGGNITIGSSTSISRLAVPLAPTASPNYGLVSLGSGAFDGSTSGFFTGAAAGTLIAGNLASGSTSDLLNLGTAGVSGIKVTSAGNTTIAGTLTVALAKNVIITEGSSGRAGQTTLVAGTKAITVTGITTNSRAFVTLVAQGGTSTTVYQYQAVCTANTLTISAVSVVGALINTDTSILNYFIIN